MFHTILNLMRKEEKNMSHVKPSLRLEKEGALGFIIIDNEERLNAMTSEMWKGLPSFLNQAVEDPDIKVLLLRGAGHKAFCAGADISEFEKNRTGESVKEYDALNEAAFETLFFLSKPTIALIEGFCFGGGLGLAACCDLRLANENALFSIPAARLGLGYPPRMVRTLLTLISMARAKELLFTARRLAANEALEFGLVNHVFSASTFEQEVRKIVDMISDNAPLTLKAAKKAINECCLKPQDPDMTMLEFLTSDCFSSADYAEGRKAFIEKRKPIFSGS